MSDDPQELVNRYSKIVKEKMEKIDNLERYLKQGLRGAFLKMKGGFEQYRDGEIDMDGLIMSGIYVLRFQFINIFLIDQKTREDAKKLNTEPEPEPVMAEVAIPDLFFNSEDVKIEKSPIREPEPALESEPEPQPEFKIEPVSKAAPRIAPEIQPQQSDIPPKQFQKIEHVKPAYVSRTERDAQKVVDIALDKINLKPIHYDKIDDSELKTVNVGARLPGGPLVNEFKEARKLIYKKEYDRAIKVLEQIKDMAEEQGNDSGFDMAIDMLANISAYKMIPVLIDAGDKVIDEAGKAGPKYKKALGFAKLVKDSHYISKIEARMKQVNERLNLVLLKKEFEDKEEDKTKQLIKYNLSILGKKESLMSIEEIRKYCNAKNEEKVIEVLIEMVQEEKIYAKYFPESGRVLFDKEANKDTLTFKNI